MFAVKKIVAFKGSFEELYDTLPQKEKDKVDRVFMLMQSDNKMPSHFINYLEDGIYELRITVKNRELRFLFLYDGQQLIILANCFVKKTRRTPRAEIEKAFRLRREYYEEKRQ